MKYKAKPTEIEAIQLLHENKEELTEIGYDGKNYNIEYISRVPNGPFLYTQVKTPNGWQRANKGHYVTKNKRGEYGVLSPERFEELFKGSENTELPGCDDKCDGCNYRHKPTGVCMIFKCIKEKKDE